MTDLEKIVAYCTKRIDECHEAQQARFIGNDVQASKCLQSRAAEATLIRLFVQQLTKPGNLFDSHESKQS